ncbi:MAG: integrase family protein [Burkholderiales bacterium]|nr:integrase family protein [Burkholderiales bacterium]
MASISLTAQRVEKAVCEAGKTQSFLWDSSTPGLGLRVTSGSKAYVFEGRVHGRSLRMTIGDVRVWPLGKAQDEARRLQVLCNSGVDPRLQRSEQAAEIEAARVEAKRAEVTLGYAWPIYIEACKGGWGERHLQDHIEVAHPGGQPKKRGKGLTVPGPLASLLPDRLSDLTSERIAKWLGKEVETRATSAAKAFRLLRAFLNWCASENDYKGLVPSDALDNRKVRDAVPSVRAKKDCLQREQLQGWFMAVRQIPNPVMSAYLQALLLTGPRPDELASVMWPDIDFQWKSITLRDKVEGERVIPLTPYVESLLASLPRIYDNPWVFSSARAESGRIQDPRFAHNKAVAESGLPHMTLHGLRRSFNTLSEWCDVPAGVVAQIMGHKPSATAEKHYRQRPLDLLRKWHTQIEDWILEQAGLRRQQQTLYSPAQPLPVAVRHYAEFERVDS